MAIDLNIIQQLCLEGESNHLDYKRDQYPFVGAADCDKAELLKDILALANAFRTEIAYVLIGVAQTSDGSGNIVGIDPTDFIDDAKLQQFVNCKTNRAINFSSYSIPCLIKKIIQVIEIPVQYQRPFHLKTRFISIGEHDVPIRIGSSTRNATLDEISRMGVVLQGSAPTLEISLIVPENTIDVIDINASDISFDKGIPLDVENSSPLFSIRDPLRTPISLSQKANWLKEIFRTVRIDIALENTSSIAAEQVIVETLIAQCANRCITEVESFPVKPSEFPYHHIPLGIRPIFEKLLRPGQCDNQYQSLYVKVNGTGDFTLEVTVLGKNFVPVKKSFHLNVKYEPLVLPTKDIDVFFELIEDEDKYLNLRQDNYNDEECDSEQS